MAEPTGNHTGEGGICPTGYYCPEGSIIPLGCPAGYYTELDNQAECTECPEGYYCLENSTTYLDTICPAGMVAETFEWSFLGVCGEGGMVLSFETKYTIKL